MGGKGIEAVPEADRPRLMTLPSAISRPATASGLVDGAVEERLLGARHAFAAGLPAELRSAVEFYDFGRYNSAATLQDNILFGRLVYGQAQADTRIGMLNHRVLNELGLRDSAIGVGLEYNVGVAGKRLPATQRQKLGIARALISGAALDRERGGGGLRWPHTGSHPRQHSAAADGRGVVWIANRPAQAEPFEQVVVMQAGRIVAQGTPSELAARGGLYTDLMASA